MIITVRKNWQGPGYQVQAEPRFGSIKQTTVPTYSWAYDKAWEFSVIYADEGK